MSLDVVQALCVEVSFVCKCFS